MTKQPYILIGQSNPTLGNQVADILHWPQVEILFKKFADDELFLKLNTDTIQQSVFIFQTLSKPANDNLIELLLMADALKNQGTQNIIACIPYLGYSRQDRLTEVGTPISAKLIAQLISSAGIQQVITLDLHSPNLIDFFPIPVLNLSPIGLFAEYIQHHIPLKDLIVVSPDLGGVERSKALANILGTDLIVIEKERLGPGLSQVRNIVGNVQGKTCVLMDDIIDSGGTLCNAAQSLKEKGAQEIHAFITHAVLSGNALEKIENSALQSMVITDSIHHAHLCPKIKVVSIGALLADSMR
jgi:ribose-phosphate pyrophosphokinase